MSLTWKEYYNKFYDGQPIQKFVNKFRLHEQQSDGPEYTEEGRKIYGFNVMILQENGYTLIQEGDSEYGLIQDFKGID